MSPITITLDTTDMVSIIVGLIGVGFLFFVVYDYGYIRGLDEAWRLFNKPGLPRKDQPK